MGTEIKENVEAVVGLESLLDDIRLTTGVSPEFIDAARPIVSRLFTQVSAKERPRIEAQIRVTIGRHAQVEHQMCRMESLLNADLESDESLGSPSDDGETHTGLIASVFSMASICGGDLPEA